MNWLRLDGRYSTSKTTRVALPMRPSVFARGQLHSGVKVVVSGRATKPSISQLFSTSSHNPRSPAKPADNRVQLTRLTTSPPPALKMSKRQTSTTSAAGKPSKPRPPPMVPRPSSSILLLSPTNQVLLLHRVQTSTSFASAHVFPGGNLSTYHEGDLIPPPESPLRHVDGPAYRLAAIRETFEESGILLALDSSGRLLEVEDATREKGRKKIHAGKVKFADWVKGLGGTPDVDGLLPFTRWVTPTNMPKRFSTQMYLYMLPLEAKDGVRKEVVVPTPTHDGGLEHTAATFDSISNWLAAAREGRIILFPPQYYLLSVLSEFIKPGEGDYKGQREEVRRFLSKTPTGREGDPTALIPWGEKVMSPTAMFMLSGDGRLVMGIDKPGPELKDSGRGGDKDRVVLVDFTKEGPKRLEVRSREEVLRLRREAEEEEAKGKL